MKWCLLLMTIANLHAYDKQTPLTDSQVACIVQAIKKTEGSKTYGIRISNHRFTESEAKRICENTVRNNYYRWQRSSSTQDYISFLADRYCPPSVDLKGNINWKHNMRHLLTTKLKKGKV